MEVLLANRAHLCLPECKWQLPCISVSNQPLVSVQIAAALKAEKLILMTDVPGVLRDKNDISTKFTELTIRQTRELVADGIIAGGMIPKYATW